MEIYSLSRYFWDFAFEHPTKIKPVHISIYFFAVEHCNRLGWKRDFGLPTSMVLEAIGVKSYSVYKVAFDQLVEYGFFDVIQYSKNQYSSNVIALKENYKAHTIAPTKALDKAIWKASEKQGESDDSIYKLITDNIKTINNRQKEFFEYVKLFFQQEQEIKFNFEKALLGLGVNSEIVKAYLSVRKKKKLVDTEIAFNGLLREIDKSGLTTKEAITICVEKSWGGFNHEWLTNIKQPTPTYSQGTYNPIQNTEKPKGWFEPIPIKD